jgi:Cu+-exporting ATPase
MSQFSFSPLISAKVTVEGMTCGHCKKRVEDALLEVPMIESADVDLIDSIAEITLTEKVEDNIVKVALEVAGYKFIKLEY